VHFATQIWFSQIGAFKSGQSADVEHWDAMQVPVTSQVLPDAQALTLSI
jgi:hypothetical protein